MTTWVNVQNQYLVCVCVCVYVEQTNSKIQINMDGWIIGMIHLLKQTNKQTKILTNENQQTLTNTDWPGWSFGFFCPLSFFCHYYYYIWLSPLDTLIDLYIIGCLFIVCTCDTHTFVKFFLKIKTLRSNSILFLISKIKIIFRVQMQLINFFPQFLNTVLKPYCVFMYLNSPYDQLWFSEKNETSALTLNFFLLATTTILWIKFFFFANPKDMSKSTKKIEKFFI